MGSKSKILAIDDEVKALNILKLVLETSGYEVLTAQEGELGIQKACIEQPDLIILDICMPKMDGWEVCKKLKFTEETKKIPVVFLTAFSSAHDQEKAKGLGVSAYLTKPVDPLELENLIKELLNANQN